MTVRIITGDCREGLRALAAGSVHCAITSPPYYGLRDYKIEPTVWGGDPACEHEWGGEQPGNNRGGSGTPTDKNGRGEGYGRGAGRGAFCRCGTWRGAFGLEPDWQMYIDHAVEVFREVRRVLRDDGTLWLNIGDSYATGAGAVAPGGGAQGAKWMSAPVARGHRGRQEARQAGKQAPRVEAMGPVTQPNRMHQAGFKPKDRMMMPARVAIALCDDGWWLRDEIIWRKPNPMPSSVEDRTTPAHEMVYLLTKRARYFYDNEAIKEAIASDSEARSRRFASVGDNPDRNDSGGYAGINGTTRNKRSVWDVTTEPFPEAHFATFPTSLVEPMIKAGTSERGCCPCCQGPWERVVEKTSIAGRPDSNSIRGSSPSSSRGTTSQQGTMYCEARTLGWQPTCKCEGAAAMATIPAVVLDPFGGAGTVGLVADRLQRDAVLLELNPGYAEMARRRIAGDAPLFAPREAAE